jgi:ribosomal protein S6--L-glutamate ligase
VRFFCVDDRAPEVTISVLRGACEARDVEFVHVRAHAALPGPLEPGDGLYRPAVSAKAIWVERQLWRADTASFHADPDGPFVLITSPVELWARLGLPVPRTLDPISTDRRQLDAQVEELSGYPVIVKFQGGEGGVGVMRADSSPALYSIIDYAFAKDSRPHLSAYVPDALHLRVIVVGDQAVTAYRNVTAVGDFRTYTSQDPDDYDLPISDELGALAVAATQALRLELAGVDILEHASGRRYLLEANFPCYFATPETVAGVDVSGALVEHLMAKSRRILGAGGA